MGSEVHVLTRFCCSLCSLTWSGGFFEENKRQALGWGLAVPQLRQGLGQELGGSLGTSWLFVLVLSRKLPPSTPGTTRPGPGQAVWLEWCMGQGDRELCHFGFCHSGCDMGLDGASEVPDCVKPLPENRATKVSHRLFLHSSAPRAFVWVFLPLITGFGWSSYIHGLRVLSPWPHFPCSDFFLFFQLLLYQSCPSFCAFPGTSSFPCTWSMNN